MTGVKSVRTRAVELRLHHHGSLAVLLLALAAVACAAADFDFFYLVQQLKVAGINGLASFATVHRSIVLCFAQWPGSYCDTEAGCCFPGDGKPPADFGIHGLWPNYAACRPDAATPNRTSCWPDFCNATDTLNTSLITDMEADLRRSWGTLSCKSKDATDFWSHEWSRHGTCSGMGQHAYFRAALDLTGALLDAGIVPSDEAEYCLGRGDGRRGADGGVQPERAQRDAAVPGVRVRGPPRPEPRQLPAAGAAWLHRHGQVPTVLAQCIRAFQSFRGE
ncbi:Ribonuclease 1 [Panicum miliaceum]|uniref:Ribonuclease 1 n=1 Tax=Panicum miliaceum TaxID=4540 RepID=A0A3L6TBU2_PANMI|nr:Ribonuclease 1 [Panicum miliaceum]